MTVNVGSADRIARLILGIVLILIPFLSGLPLFEAAGWTWGAVIVGAVMIVTGATRFCGLYRLLGVNTCRNA